VGGLVLGLHTRFPVADALVSAAADPILKTCGSSTWEPLSDALAASDALGKLDVSCAAAQGMFARGGNGCSLRAALKGGRATAFLLELSARLQALATVPMIDVRAYAKRLTK